jgi:hypothetical protein
VADFCDPNDQPSDSVIQGVSSACLLLQFSSKIFLSFSSVLTHFLADMGERRDARRVLVGRPEGRRFLGIPRIRWEDNIKLGFQEIGKVGVH